MKNYFSNRITISEIRAEIGAPPELTIQKLQGLTIKDSLISTFPGVGDATFTSIKNTITMNVDGSGEYTGALYIQDPNVSKIGVPIPPVGTIGYFAKDEIPDGWLEIGSPIEYIAYKRKVGTYANGDAIFIDTEYTELYKLLDSWGLVRSTSDIEEGLGFNVESIFKGYFIRSYNPSSTGPDVGANIFDSQWTYLSVHTHDGNSLYSSSVGGTIDRGYRSYLFKDIQQNTGLYTTTDINYFGTTFWYNYSWHVSYGWDMDSSIYGTKGGSVKVTTSNYNSSPLKYAVNYDDHVHGRIQTYYRGYDGMYGKITHSYDIDNYRLNQTWVRDSEWTGSPYASLTNASTAAGTFTSAMKQELTYYDPYDGSKDSNLNYTLYPDWSNYSTRQTVSSFRYTFPGGQTALMRNTIDPRVVVGTSTEYKKATRIDLDYYPYHILESVSSTQTRDEFYNSGYDGAFVSTTTPSGNHSHSYTHDHTHRRGHGESRPNNISLRMCLKY